MKCNNIKRMLTNCNVNKDKKFEKIIRIENFESKYFIESLNFCSILKGELI